MLLQLCHEHAVTLTLAVSVLVSALGFTMGLLGLRVDRALGDDFMDGFGAMPVSKSNKEPEGIGSH